MGRPLFSKARLDGLPETGRLVVGFSGGADSTALVHWLMGRVEKERLVLAHVNHLLRGEEALRDQNFVEAFAKAHGLRVEILTADVGRLAKERGQSTEECGREVRYGFFHRLACGEDDRVLTAHNANDNTETILMNLCRGAALEGLCGIPYRWGKILRPLLAVSREEIEAYCQEHRLNYVTDSSNLSDDYTRNRVRHQIVPLFRELNPQFVQALSQTAALAGADRDFLQSSARRLLEEAQNDWGLEAALLLAAPEAVRGRALKLFLERAGCGRLEKKHLELAGKLLAQGGEAVLPGGITAACAQGVLWAGQKRTGIPYEFPVKRGENPLPGGKILILEKKIRTETEKPGKIQNLLFKNALDCDIMTGTLKVRSRRAGDRFAPAGRGLSKPLKQVFQELRVPAALRDGVPLLTCGEEIAWVQGAGAAERFKVSERTREVWTVRVREG